MKTSYCEPDFIFIFSSKTMEERYEHKTHVHVQQMVRLSQLICQVAPLGPMIRGPHFLVRLRSHTVFENTSVKLFCTVDGFPMPTVKWYKDDVILDVSSGRYLLDRTGGIHSLEILRYSEPQGRDY
ncbi:Myomesin-1 190 kDa connectin-associated protein 190 kDa titin-associated protein [Takifugu flavidus]|uniref:non-specific serine/threonine protein kinase n=1 Tax=Takifugu flavidus TaxID=433684 RepID=A0A5C6NL71_9TELE|nr:Myomesin-1 190 kDa connectin-associated protein 190 kDa titin-associated protein [Takifugu flavidus]